jgi:hypothetical protein
MEEQEISEQAKNLNSKKRPTAITVLCVLGFVGSPIAVLTCFSESAIQIGSWYPPYLGFSSALGLICMIGLWKMKKWAAYVYTGFVVLNQVVLLSMGVWNIMALIVPSIYVGIALYHLKKMD